jgi:TetR/AcrR family transcriptional repressor of nem operon
VARPRKFSEDQVLTCAMLTFWRLGFDATTMRELERVSGVGVRSLHNTFGEKEELFLKALQTYRAMAQDLLAQMFAEPGPEAIAQMFEGSVAPAETDDDPRKSGCLMVNSVMELADMSDQIAAEVAAYRQMFIDTFQAALEAGGVPDPGAKADYLLGSLWGLLSQIRLAGDPVAAAPMAKVVAETVRGWQATRLGAPQP